MSGGSYLNSSVSLISKACVRYEGTLYSIDPQEATITLSKVRSFGTEDRKLEGFIAPSDTVFDFIIFNANDIKELIVDEPLNDPAIVTAQMPTSTTKNANTGFNENQSSQQNGVSEQAGLKNINQQSNLASASSAGQNDCFKSRGSTPSSSQARSPTSELSSNKQKTDLHKTGMNRNQNQNNRNNMNNMNNNRKAWDNRGSNFYNNQRFDNRNNNRNLNYNNNMNRRPGNYQNNNYSNYNQRNQGFRRNDDRVPNMPNKNGYRNNNNNNINNRGVRKFNPQNKKVDPTLKTEFDFERANQVFQQMVEKLDDLNLSLNGEKGEKSDAEDKEETKNEIEKVDKADEESNFYDKTKSFFDNISCEAAERSKGTKNRLNWKQERKLNAETFGFKITYRRNDYNGGYRSRPAYNNNNNNNRNVSNRRYNNNNNNGNRNTTRMNSS